MVVVADTSPLNYLILIGEIRLLPKLYGRILVPEQVLEELSHPEAPAAVAKWAANLPSWMDVAARDSSPIDDELAYLDSGESAAIRLAQDHTNALLLIDETAGRAEAARRHIATVGTLGILRDAAALNHVNLASAFARLRATTFRASEELMDALLAQEAGRKNS